MKKQIQTEVPAVSKITVNRKELEREIAIAKKVIGTGNNLNICQSVMLTFLNDNGLALESTNLEHSYLGVIGTQINRKYRLPARAKRILVNLDRLKKIVTAIPKKTTEIPLEITWDGNGLLVNGTTTIVCGGLIDDYPNRPKLPWGSSYNLLSYEKLNQVNSIPASDDKRAHIISLYVDTKAGRIVSTDSSRLHIIKTMTVSHLKPFLFAKNTAKILTIPQLKNEIGNVRVDDSNAFIETGHGFITTRLIESDFPDYKAVVDRDPIAIISTSDKQYMIDVMAEAAGILNEHYRGVAIDTSNGIVVSAVNPDCGEFSKDISTEFTFDGESFNMAFNSIYIVDACKCIPDKGLNLFVLENGPVIAESASGDFQAAIMPMRI